MVELIKETSPRQYSNLSITTSTDNRFLLMPNKALTHIAAAFGEKLKDS